MTLLLLAAQFRDEITLGSTVIAALLGLAALVTIGLGVRWRSNAEVYAAEAKAHRERAERLQTDLREAHTLIGEQKERVEKLESIAMPDAVIELVEKSAERIDSSATERMIAALRKMEQMFENHEKRAQERHAAQMEVLREILKEAA